MRTYDHYAILSDDEHDEYVPADVAQALYDALKPFTRKESLRDTYSFEVDQALSALSLADGETE